VDRLSNPAHLFPSDCRAAARRDARSWSCRRRHHETARFADLLLPAASWGEGRHSDQLERRISVRRAIVAPGEASDWAITVDFAQRLGYLRPEATSLFA
jgi:assimilatory nitrate reductase catalytic subunit